MDVATIIELKDRHFIAAQRSQWTSGWLLLYFGASPVIYPQVGQEKESLLLDIASDVSLTSLTKPSTDMYVIASCIVPAVLMRVSIMKS